MKKKNLKRCVKYLLIMMLFVNGVSGQYYMEWEKVYGGSVIDYGFHMSKTADGGYILSGMSESDDIDITSANGGQDTWIVKVDENGNLEWENSYGTAGDDGFTGIIQTTDGGYIMPGKYFGEDSLRILKLDAVGNVDWSKQYGGSGSNGGSSIVQTTDGGFIVAGSSTSVDGDLPGNNGNRDAWLLKIDVNGNVEWSQNYGGSNREYTLKVLQVLDGYVVIGGSESNDIDVPGNNGDTDGWLFKTDVNGNLEWSQNYGGPFEDSFRDIKQTNEGGFVLCGKTSFHEAIQSIGGWIVKVDEFGNLEWEQSDYDDHFSSNAFHSIFEVEGGFIATGATFVTSAEYWVVKTDINGNMQWEQIYGGGFNDYAYRSYMSPDENELVLFGKVGDMQPNIQVDPAVSGFPSTSNGGSDYWLVKLKKLKGDIAGRVYLDNNEDCIYNGGDTVINNIIVQTRDISSENIRYSNTDEYGWFNFFADTTTYEVSIASELSNSYWESSVCSPDTHIVNLSSVDISDTIDFYLKPSILCPYMEVDIAAPLFRRCRTNSYHVSYCNYGTAIAEDAYVEVTIDPLLIIGNSSIPYSLVSGSTYSFQIGDVGLFDCGDFSFRVAVPCDSTAFLGRVMCAEAHIYPDSICLPSTSTWSGAELEANVECIGTDSVEFSVKNIGTGATGANLPTIGIEDVILIMDTFVSLDPNEEISWKLPINGITQRIIAQQPADHPYRTFTTAAVSNCTMQNTQLGWNDSTFMSYPNDEEAPYVAIDCQEIVGAFDPNDKSVYPKGISSSHFISETMDLEYKIRFQNTGNDTAFTVVIRDSISGLLDISTFTAGPSSHPYTYNIYGNGVVDFTFNNILLPDSFVNEPASHGFVQYKIEQQAGNQVGDVITNNADIFFDYNLPIRTNTVFNTIGGMILDTMIYKFPEEDTISGIREVKTLDISVYPNPAIDFMIFELDQNHNEISLELYDMSGRLQQKSVGVNTNQLKLERNQLPEGVYIFKIFTDNNEVAYGKIIFK